MRRAFVAITGEVLAESCKPTPDGEWFRVKAGVPADAKFVGAEYDAVYDELRVFFDHDSFPEAGSGEPCRQLPSPEVEAWKPGEVFVPQPVPDEVLRQFRDELAKGTMVVMSGTATYATVGPPQDYVGETKHLAAGGTIATLSWNRGVLMSVSYAATKSYAEAAAILGTDPDWPEKDGADFEAKLAANLLTYNEAMAYRGLPTVPGGDVPVQDYVKMRKDGLAAAMGQMNAPEDDCEPPLVVGD